MYQRHRPQASALGTGRVSGRGKLFWCSSAQIGGAHALILQQLTASSFKDNMTIFKNISAVGTLQSDLHVLFNQEEAQALLAVDHIESIEQIVHDLGRQAQKSSSISNSSGWLIKPRPIAHICCSPPESEPANWRRRSRSFGRSV